MKRNASLILAEQFGALAHGATSGEILDQDKCPVAIVRDIVASIDPDVDLDGITNRSIPYLFCTEKVARDGHTVSVAGIDLTGFNANPVFLWAHDSGEPPIGRVNDITRENGLMRGTVEYMDPDLSPFADMVFRMVKKRFLNATSISWMPLEWKFSQDRARPGGIDFIRSDLLEISQVPVPAQATALATARAAGIDTSPMFRWAEKVLDGGSKVIIPRAELETLRSAAKMPLPARSRTASADLAIAVPAKKRMFARGLYEVGWLASLLADLDCIAEWSEWEKEYEGDDSDVPARLFAVLQTLGQILKDMTVEEVDELLGMEGEDVAVVDDGMISQAAKTPGQRAILRLANIARAAAAQNARKFVVEAAGSLSAEAVAQLRDGFKRFMATGDLNVLVLSEGMTMREVTSEQVTPLRALIEKRIRAGRVLSTANEQALRDALDLIDGVVSQVAAQPEESDAADVTEVDDVARRVRIARALAIKGSGE